MAYNQWIQIAFSSHNTQQVQMTRVRELDSSYFADCIIILRLMNFKAKFNKARPISFNQSKP